MEVSKSGAKTHGNLVTGIALCLVFVLSSLLALQGWRSRPLTSDDAIPALDALALRNTGTIPKLGTSSSFGVLIPPGTTWFWALGTISVREAQLLPYPGALLLHFGTLLALVLLAGIFFRNWWVRVLVGGLYGFSQLGLYFAGSLWPRGHPFFVAWCVYFLALWVLRRQSWWLMAAIVTYFAGAYYFMEIAPLGLVFAAVWICFRPPVRVAPVAAGLVVSLLIWWPYIYRDSKAGFRNLTALVMRKSLISPTDPSIRWCDPAIVFRRLDVQDRRPVFSYGENYQAEVEKVPRNPLVRALKEAAKGYLKIVDGTLANFRSTTVLPGIAGALCAAWVLSLLSLWSKTTHGGWLRQRRLWVAGGLLAACLLAIGLYGYTLIVARSNPELAPEWKAYDISVMIDAAVFGVIASLFGPRLIADTGEAAAGTMFPGLLLAITAPAFLMIVIAERGHTNRLWWLWPLQVLILAALCSGLKANRMGTLALLTGFVLGCVANPIVLSRLPSLFHDGFAGKASYTMDLLDSLGRQLRAEGRNSVKIGYHLPFEPWVPLHSAVSPLFKVGMENDLYLNLQYGIDNQTRCAEGVSPNDEFRLADTQLHRMPDVEQIYAEVSDAPFSRYVCEGELCLLQAASR
jgi:hypothetical protein